MINKLESGSEKTTRWRHHRKKDERYWREEKCKTYMGYRLLSQQEVSKWGRNNLFEIIACDYHCQGFKEHYKAQQDKNQKIKK